MIVGSPRTGTELLTRLLDQHPDCLARGELFNQVHDYRGLVCGRRYEDGEDGASFLERFYSLHPSMPAVGFKLHYAQARESPAARRVWTSLVSDHTIRVVFTLRDNLLAQLVSLEQAQLSHDWSLKVGRAPSFPEPVCIAPEDAAEFFRNQVAVEQELEQIFANHKHLTVEYERIARNPHDEVNRVFSFLGLTPTLVYPPLAKQAVATPSTALANFNELSLFFRCSEYARFFVITGGTHVSLRGSMT